MGLDRILTPTLVAHAADMEFASLTSICQACPAGATGLYPTDKCLGFRYCVDGIDKGTNKCPAGGLLFDEKVGSCNWANQVTCNCNGVNPPPTLPPISNSPPPTATPIANSPPPTATPIANNPPSPPTPPNPSPTAAPIANNPPSPPTPPNPSPTPPTPPNPSPTPPTSSSAAAKVEEVLEANKAGIDNNILLYKTPQLQWVPSTVYRYQGLIDAIRVMYKDGIAGKYFYMGDETPYGYEYGLVNIAAFLAQSMKETIQYNACDENNWDMASVDGKSMYALSNSCGQLGQSYQDYKCSHEEQHMACAVDPTMEIKATTNAAWWGAPGPLYCAPKTKQHFTGKWNPHAVCDDPWANPPKYCTEYPGQKGGAADNSFPFANVAGRTDVEGCCWWGRGVIQTTGPCNFGKLNYFLGKKAHDEGRPSRYPDVDFCKTPNAVCDSKEHPELKWIAGLFYWVESVQGYNVGDGWTYVSELQKFVDGGMKGTSFIDSISGIVNRGCHKPPCAAGPVDGGPERAQNFKKVLKELQMVVAKESPAVVVEEEKLQLMIA